jgi:hypothetical protein
VLDGAGVTSHNRTTLRKIPAVLAALAVLALGILLALRLRAPEMPSVLDGCFTAEVQRETAAKAPAPLPPDALRDFLTRQGIDARSLATVSGALAAGLINSGVWFFGWD